MTRGKSKMSTIQLIELIINAKSRAELIEILNANRIPTEKSKYC